MTTTSDQYHVYVRRPAVRQVRTVPVAVTKTKPKPFPLFRSILVAFGLLCLYGHFFGDPKNAQVHADEACTTGYARAAAEKIILGRLKFPEGASFVYASDDGSKYIGDDKCHDKIYGNVDATTEGGFKRRAAWVVEFNPLTGYVWNAQVY